jgi:hypothetical protein
VKENTALSGNGSQKAVLCMIDLSDDSRRALEVAAKCATEDQAELVVLYPYRLKSQGIKEQKSTLKQRMEEEAYSRFDYLKESVQGLEAIPYIFSPEVGFEVDRLEAHLFSRSVERVFFCKAISSQADMANELNDFLKSLSIPVVLVP